MDYNGAKALLSTARSKENGKPIGNHTRIIPLCGTEIDGNNLAIRLHDTNIVIFAPDGTITLNSGGLRTVTTKERINDALLCQGLRVTANNGMWYIGGSVFYDNMTIKDGVVLNPQVPASTEYYKKKVDKMVKGYIDGFVNHIVENGLEHPDGGDCWECLMKTTAGKPAFGDGVGHLLSHMEENYFVPSLLANAMAEKKYGNPQFVWDWMTRDVSFRKDEGRTILKKYFRSRKLALAEELMKQESHKM
jgi:hypothetical protein